MNAFKLSLLLGLTLALCLSFAPLAAEEIISTSPEETLAYRWLAMADFYAREDLLNGEARFYVEAGDCLCVRWLAMARFYEQNKLLTRPEDLPPEPG